MLISNIIFFYIKYISISPPCPQYRNFLYFRVSKIHGAQQGGVVPYSHHLTMFEVGTSYSMPLSRQVSISYRRLPSGLIYCPETGILCFLSNTFLSNNFLESFAIIIKKSNISSIPALSLWKPLKNDPLR